MPKVLPLSAIERKKLEFTKWIRGKCAAERIRHRQLAEKWHIAQPTATNRVNSGEIKYSDLVILFKVLDATDEEILRMMKM